jgi:hypothetical protein
MDWKRFNTIVDSINSPFGDFRLGNDGPAYWLQFCIRAIDYTNKIKETMWHCRKWRISRHATEREVVGTAFLAITTALEHEARESFTYKGLAIFGPHIPLEGLAGASILEPDERKSQNLIDRT